ncbi:MAG: PIN domain-containing protein [Tannerellaceae bacterium]|jgi:tRNA(fMet)-specific endonuclease VapC|nr:PIN domain-containing protein [Tannerellaceae bacterium]
MIQYLLDTNICVFYLRGQLRLDEFVKGKWREHCCISEVTVLELYFGAENSPFSFARFAISTVLELYFGAENSNYPCKHYEAVSTFLQDVSVFPISTCALVYAKEKTRFRKAGTPVNDEFDLIIASSAIAGGLTLVTDNVKHFKDFENIKIENWFRN